MNHFKLIIDFDSTFVKVETLDILAEVCFEKEVDKISKINVPQWQENSITRL